MKALENKLSAAPNIAAESSTRGGNGAGGGRNRAALGQRLGEARRRIEQSGIPLLDSSELEREKAERRGGISEDRVPDAPIISR